MSADPLLLSLDTATPCCSVAITRGGSGDGEVIASLGLGSGTTHSRKLLGAIEWLLSAAGMVPSELDGVAVGLGPGSFTGLRIGMATAKGLCYGSGLPLFGVCSLDSIGVSLRSTKRVWVVLDAKTREVYCGSYQTGVDGFMERCSDIRVMKPDDLAAALNEPVILAGDGVDAYLDTWQTMTPAVEFAPLWHRFPRADMIGLLAADQARNGHSLDLATAVPLYVRATAAELIFRRHQEQG
ncbi:MAG: tRNA (adenosine(37)-N6)-threonylcarbamoyltransferase complex dimerization subunit type 1 TsaB [Desulfofustis sp. PB-SRB1]|jgi:tRNA threonylcarbamoyladenosine biosynthesis protein TsaB|nr:tRNA (adenosine(37)-N6)-threonylcarbamoyltransferase complex dimerization subunit type 1 TsaB [Desulfofustis sp. PB-SRB1]MBM1003817.1 tRNA (adenosine(37)-N6)-threonylcarbamoyltransferase complex dimerization subunit type 1 TsaB [Desulfofustis sp. PB-SRB1]HBH30038.1 tRNA (adenosine(37)-N6)-threonylcarbamoyltransferase complex dimerization subunit type 1 TsaB [Desulfofustis sp.]HBH31860.1 tRNA (adenosine(37)-N6)-threonylcarbamoyltransferase complex dimerization subunit type 1 TsaB [Desulfofusti